ncbi:MAG: DUF2254 domain-containing protein, partial [SAR324 cluster bacterium]|nr:DUF2254 domain-containing protein [SAR324 cluster bacterium]
MPFGMIAGFSVAAYFWFHFLDLQLSGDAIRYSDVIFLSNAEDVGNALGGVSEVLIAILGLVVTVVAIVVQLASQRYTP